MAEIVKIYPDHSQLIPKFFKHYNDVVESLPLIVNLFEVYKSVNKWVGIDRYMCLIIVRDRGNYNMPSIIIRCVGVFPNFNIIVFQF